VTLVLKLSTLYTIITFNNNKKKKDKKVKNKELILVLKLEAAFKKYAF
jgi:predicted transcriptional regulator